MSKIYGDNSSEYEPNSEWTNFKYKPNSGDPVSCSIFFHKVVEAILKNILGYDKDTKTYKSSILGTVQGHYAVIEEQQRKTLHIHMLVFVKEFEDYSEFHAKMQSDEKYNTTFLTYIDRLLCEEFDSSLDLEPSPRTRAPFYYLCPPLQKDTWKIMFKKEHEAVQRITQQHSCQTHCLKNNGRCRYSFPKQIIKETHYNKETKKLELKRNDSNINTNLPIITALCRSNNDIQFLPGKGDPRISRFIAYYISNYTSKTSSQDIDILSYMMKQLESTYQKYEDKKVLLESPNKLFGSLLRRTLNHFVAGTEIGGPEAASLLLGFDDHYTSHEFVPIDWKKWDIWVCKSLVSYHEYKYNRIAPGMDNYNHILTAGQNHAECNFFEPISVPHNNMDDYLFRPLVLESLCLWEFASYYRFSTYIDTESVGQYSFLKEHPLLKVFGNAGVVQRKNRQFPTLPWFNASSTAHGVGTEDFARIMCTLFIPFRFPTDILLDSPNFIARHTAFKIDKSLIIEPISTMLNIEYNAANAKEAQNFTLDTNSSFPYVRALSNELLVSEELASLQNLGWERFEFHVPIDDAIIPSACRTTEDVVKNIEREISKENNRQEEQLLNLNNTDFDGCTVTFLPEISRSSYNEYVKSLKTVGTCSDQWNTVKLVAEHIWGLCFDSENTHPIRVMLHGEGFVIIIY